MKLGLSLKRRAKLGHPYQLALLGLILTQLLQSSTTQEPPPQEQLQNVSAIPLNPRSIRVEWSSSSEVVTGYRVTAIPDIRDDIGIQPVYEEEVSEETVGYTFTGLSPYSYGEGQDGVVYNVTVQAVNTNGEGPKSDVQQVIIPPCAGFCNFVHYRGTADCECVCNPAYTGEQCLEPTFYPVNLIATEVRMDSLYTLQISWEPPPTNRLDGRLITSYEVMVQRLDESLTHPEDVAVDVGANETSYEVTGLLRNTNYSVTVSTTSDIPDSAPQTINILTLPSEVRNLAASSNTTAIFLSWDPPLNHMDTITGYQVTYTNAGDASEGGSLVVSDSSATISGLHPGTSYVICVFPQNAAGNGEGARIIADTAADCGSLTDPANGQVALTGTTETSTATYSCNTGYALMGVSMRTCQSDGSWSAQPPVCTLVDCGSLTDPENGQVIMSGTILGSTANYSCNPGYILVGVETRTCQTEGEWSEETPVCTLDCGNLTDPENGQVTLSGTTLGSTANYSCNPGYFLAEGSMLTCQPNGQWSEQPPVCTSCLLDHYCTNSASVSCPMSSGSMEGSDNIADCVCLPGYTGSDGGPCTECPVRTFKASSGSAMCVSCSPLLTTISTASTTCDQCRLSSGTPPTEDTCYAFETSVTLADPNESSISPTSITVSWTPVSVVFDVNGNMVGNVLGYELWCIATRGLLPDGYQHELRVEVSAESRYTFDNLQPLVEYSINASIIAQVTAQVVDNGPPSQTVTATTMSGSDSALPQISQIDYISRDSVRVRYVIDPEITELITSFQLVLSSVSISGVSQTDGDPQMSEFIVTELDTDFVYRFLLATQIGLFTYLSDIVRVSLADLSHCRGSVSSPSGCESVTMCDYQARYTVRGDSIDFEVTAMTDGWVGIGFSDNIFMPDSDIVIGVAIDSFMSVTDRFAVARSEPPQDSNQDIANSVITNENSITTMQFTRPRITNDTNDLSLDQCRYFLAAWGGTYNSTTETYGYHGSRNRFVSNEKVCPAAAVDCPDVLFTATTTPLVSPTPTSTQLPPLPPPTTIDITILSGTSVRVTWSVVEGANGYLVVLSDLTEEITSGVIGGSVTSKQFTDLIPFTNYSVQVASIQAGGTIGSFSASMFITTPEERPGPPTNVNVTERDADFIVVSWSPPTMPNGIITAYQVILTTGDGNEMVFTVDPDQLSIILERPAGEYTAMVLAINSAGQSTPQQASVVVDETTAPATDSSDLQIAFLGGVVAGGVIFLLLGVFIVSCIAICCYCRYRRTKTGAADLVRENSYIYSSAEDLTRMPGEGMELQQQLTAKRWMRTHGNYSTASAVLSPLPDKLYTITTDDVVHVETSLCGNEGAGEAMRKRALPPLPPPSTRPPSYLEAVRDATPNDYGNEELYQSMQQFYFVDVDDSNSLAQYELDRFKLEIKEQVGQGEFGRVMKGALTNIIPGQPKCRVAVKMLKEKSTDDERKDFLGEAHMMAQFRHPNVMGLLGVVTATMPILVIIDFMPSGDLKTYLKKQKKTRSKNFGIPNQIDIAKQIAAGMEYLAAKFFIHRDLAARNVLVGEHDHVKISDFGLSRALQKEDTYYRLSAVKKLPVKWMALESLEYKKFSTYSDIWSFGIVLWEIFSYGTSPYKGTPPTEVLRYLQNGNRLHCPEECPQAVYEVMVQCWSETKEERPTFSQLKVQLNAIAPRPTSLEESCEDEYVNDNMGPS